MDIYRRLFGKRLREARKAIPLFTQADLAEKLGVEPSTVSRWETGKDFPEPKRVKGLCDALNVPLSYFDATDAIAMDDGKNVATITHPATAVTEALVQITRLIRENSELKQKIWDLEYQIDKLERKVKMPEYLEALKHYHGKQRKR